MRSGSQELGCVLITKPAKARDVIVSPMLLASADEAIV